jgi:hypothetical protein
MLIKTGGGSLDLGRHGGIHWWHIYSDNKIMYFAADKHRQKIVWVELTTPDGQVRIYTRKSDKLPPIAEIKAKARVMDCIDCHNRPTHLFKKPDHALDDVLAAHPKMQQLPFFKKVALDAINKGYKTHEGGMTAVQRAVLTYYQQKRPAVWSAREELVRRAADAASRVYGRSFFPAMKTDWKTHPDNLGHRDFPGCWRCHDDEMSTADGKHTIPQDCDTCHIFLEEDSPKPPVFQDLMAQQ